MSAETTIQMNDGTNIDPGADERPDYGMPVHPVCDLFPLIGGNEFLTLGDDIRANGLVHPIVVHEGQIVDGRNRLLACKDVGVEPRYIEWKQIYNGPMTLAQWIWSVNVERRHLTLDQIIAVQVGIKAWEEQEAARQRQVDAGARGKEGGRGHKKTLPDKRPEGFSTSTSEQPAAKRPKDRSGETAIKIAKDVGVSERKVRQALTVQKSDPGLLTDVAKGRTTLCEAAKKVKSKAKPKPAKPKPRAFDLEREIRKVVRRVDAVVGTCGDAARTAFLDELIKTLEAMK